MKPATITPGSSKGEESKFKRLFIEIWKHRMTYTLLLPGLIWLILFAYLPMGGLSLAFKEYRANDGIWGSAWIGFENFKYVFRDPAFADAVWRTLYVNIIKLFITFPFPILLALLLNELRMRRYKKVLQTAFTFPHFLSWIIVSGIIINVLAYDGLVNSFLALIGLPTAVSEALGKEDQIIDIAKRATDALTRHAAVDCFTDCVEVFNGCARLRLGYIWCRFAFEEGAPRHVESCLGRSLHHERNHGSVNVLCCEPQRTYGRPRSETDTSSLSVFSDEQLGFITTCPERQSHARSEIAARALAQSYTIDYQSGVLG